MGEKKNGRKWRIQAIHERSAVNDIRYRGPLSYRHLRILGWICIFISQIALLLSLAGTYSPELEAKIGPAQDVLSFIASQSVTLLLLANFAIILNARGRYRILFALYGGVCVILFLLVALFFEYYGLGIVSLILGDSRDVARVYLMATLQINFIAFNPFVDLFLCTLLIHFLNGQPKRFFTGKRILIFRCFAILPILYEVGCIYAKALASVQLIEIPVIFYPLLPTKPPITFLVFVAIAVFLKVRERIFLRNGKTHEDYL
ncbi:MAG: hypothetical protein ACSW8H_06005, partial [bacterium]